MVEVGRHYGLTLASCVPADPQSKGGSEATVRIAAADLVPTDANLLPSYARFAEFRCACDDGCDRFNARPQRATRCPPIERLAQERERLHPLPTAPFTAAFGISRSVGDVLSVVHFFSEQEVRTTWSPFRAIHLRVLQATRGVPVGRNRHVVQGGADSDAMNDLGKPGAGERHARIDGRGLETEHGLGTAAPAA
ncbi:MAG: hypothetical protein JO023_04590 [Chloroflexi bacterium]|nr:hypothetical protein [Chloroflexota bacterium]